MIKTNIEDIYDTNEEPNKIDFTNGRNIIYFNRRKDLKNLIKTINAYINNSSQSFFLTLYFMDSIFTNINLENIFFNHFTMWDYLIPLKDIQMDNYALLAVACLILSYKFNENDPKLPSMPSFLKLLYHFSNKNFIFSVHDLAMAEVVVSKLLKYKLNYYTIYHFFVFFFTHGILFRKTLKNSTLFGKFSEKIILEKIYIQAREILDWIVESEKYFNYYFGKDNHIIVAEILLWSIEHILGTKIQDYENIFKLIYNIKIRNEKHLKIYEIIDKLYSLKKGSIENNSKPIFINKDFSKKILTYNNPSAFSTTTNIKKSSYNYNSIQNQNGNITTSYNNNYNTLSSYEDSFSFYNSIINKELEKFKNQYPYQYTVPNKAFPVERIQNIPHPKVIGLKNRNFYDSKKNIISSYDIDSIIPINSNVMQTVHDNLEFEKNGNNIEKVPTDSHKKKNISSNKIKEINIEDAKGGKILLNNISSKIKKKSLSCSKQQNSTIDYNYHELQIKSSFLDTTNDINNNNNLNSTNYNNIYDMNKNNEDELKFEEKINKPKIFNNKIKINISNHLYTKSPNLPIQVNIRHSINKDRDKTKETLYKRYQHSINDYNPKQINKKYDNKNLPKINIISNDELINKTKTLYKVTKINQTEENEPRDNNRRSINKLKKKSQINNININDINNSINKINKHNTIIINNNIHINTYIDNKKSNEKIIQNIYI